MLNKSTRVLFRYKNIALLFEKNCDAGWDILIKS